MIGIKQHILEKLKVSSNNGIPSIDEFIKEFEKYMDRSERPLGFSQLESCEGYDIYDPETFIKVLPPYKFTGDEEFLNLLSNRGFDIPKDTIYINGINMFKVGTEKSDDYRFIIHYLPEIGVNASNLRHKRYFYISKEDLIDIIGEDKYLEIYEYLKNTNN